MQGNDLDTPTRMDCSNSLNRSQSWKKGQENKDEADGSDLGAFYENISNDSVQGGNDD